MSKPIKMEELRVVYKCPECAFKNPYEDATARHIYLAHSYPALEKEVKLFGSQCEFISEEQAEHFAKRYADKRSDMDSRYYAEVKWEGPGKYHFTDTMIRDFHPQSDLGREYKLTFHRFAFQ